MPEFYRRHFLDAEAKVGSVMEWGVGHGLFTLLASRSWPQAQIFALDISQHSLDFSRSLLKADGAEQRDKFFSADILSPDVTLPCVDRLICSELMEHVPDPHALGRRVYDVLNKDGKAFVTAAINAPQPDHIYLFRSRQEVEDLIVASKLHIEAALPVVHPNHKGREGAPTVLAMVVAKADRHAAGAGSKRLPSFQPSQSRST
jgi:ubiquinone/menaquinone biosynthesis C-methylase UbiE